MVEKTPSLQVRVLAADALGAAAIAVATAAAANNGAIMRALVVIVNPLTVSLRRPSDRYGSERRFGLIVKTPLVFSLVQRGTTGRGSKNLKNF
jgi:hypothetical protein